MNPHFIFNCINSIDSLIQSNDKYLATIYLNKFAKLIRNILDSSKLNRTTLAKDLETLKLYIELEQFRNENKFTAEVTADPSLLQGNYKVPPLVIQPYVENAIIHGLRNRPDNEGKLNVTITRLEGYIQYIIEDNGVGRKNTIKDQPAEKNSYGMEMSSERIRLFNQEEHASVTITDLEENGAPKGTKVEVLLKMI
jgi:LytS/YehU family sensor histidine kinase